MTDPQLRNRYHSLDLVRAVAMLLGVYYHALLFGGMAGGGPRPSGPFGNAPGVNPSMMVQEYLHSFRMPLFFIVSGFFCNMMLQKYGLRNYMARRWFRIGVPLLVGLFTFVPLYVVARESVRSGPPMFGDRPNWVVERARGMGPPPSFDAASKTSPELRGPRFGPPGERNGGGPFGSPGPVSAWLFGPSVRYFTMNHFWFLWYLLAFATAMPLIIWATTRLVPPRLSEFWNRMGFRAMRLHLVPLAVALISLPALRLTSSFSGWSLGFAAGIGRGFPDFAWTFEPDMPFYGIYFLTGWWLFGYRESIDRLASGWWFNLIVGLALHLAAAWMSRRYANQVELPYYSELRWLGYGMYAAGSAYTAWGFLGVFERFANRPLVVGRYLADTAFWIYLLHQALLFPFLAWLAPFNFPWWLNALTASALTTVAAILLFESFVRVTPLNALFGTGRLIEPRGESNSLMLVHDVNVPAQHLP